MRCGLILLAALTALGGCGAPRSITWSVPGGDPRRGEALFWATGCSSCHTTGGIAGARGRVGPPLEHMSGRAVIAGVLPNTPEAMIFWIEAPQHVAPGNAMPDLGLSDQQARDLAAYVYTLD